MKLRILDNSIRLRLTQGEVRALREGGAVAARTEFPDASSFAYAIECTQSCARPAAGIRGSALTITLPERLVRTWADSEQVSIRDEVPLDGGSSLVILVEKDFACLVPREGENESDMFPNPATASC